MKKIHVCPNCSHQFRCGEPFRGPLLQLHEEILQILREKQIALTSRQVFNILYARKHPSKLGTVQGRLSELGDLGLVRKRLDGRKAYWSYGQTPLAP